MWVLDCEFLGDFGTGFWAEDLLAADPAVLVNEGEPAFDYVETVHCQ